jgi:hypothetical protein
MSRRTSSPLEGTARSRLDSLLNVLRAPGDNPDLIRARALNLLGYKPSGFDRDQWLRDHLPQEWHVEKTLAALGNPCGSNETSTTEAAATPAQPTGRRRHRRGGRNGH